VFNIAVAPRVHAEVEVFPNDGRAARVLVRSADQGWQFERCPEDSGWGRHALVEGTLNCIGVPGELALRVTIASDAPPGAGTGTSAAVTVALVGALSAVRDARLPRAEAARLAHAVETDVLGGQSGVQDQLAAAHGGINFIEVRYPASRVHRLAPDAGTSAALERRLMLVYLGRAHASFEIHEQVIRGLEGRGAECQELEDLRAAATGARDALLGGDLEQLGRALAVNTEAQARLHPALVGGEARTVIDVARAHGAAGWKVNGAGGAGGSIAVLGPADPGRHAALAAAIRAADPRFRIIPIALDEDGLVVTG
jgi:D-glycero-alpha-D-manno-heptose-7-phosphate kinase